MNTSQPQLNSLTDSDLELLSAYIDDQLDAADRAALERRLGAEPRLRAELAELRGTAALLRDLEPLRPSRSFTLDPSTVRRRRPLLSLAWTMQLGGGLAGFVLVLLASVQMLFGVSMGSAAAPAPAAMQAQSTALAPVSAQAFGVAEATPAATEAAALEMAPAPTPAPAAAMPAATEAPAATQDPAAAAMATGPQDATAARSAESSGPSTNDAPAGGSVGAAAPTMAVATSEPSSPDTADPVMPAPGVAPKAAPEPASVSPAWLFGLGIALLALSLGAFLYRRSV